MVVMIDYTTISVKKETAEKLKSLWEHADDTFDSIINELIRRPKRK